YVGPQVPIYDARMKEHHLSSSEGIGHWIVHYIHLLPRRATSVPDISIRIPLESRLKVRELNQPQPFNRLLFEHQVRFVELGRWQGQKLACLFASAPLL